MRVEKAGLVSQGGGQVKGSADPLGPSFEERLKGALQEVNAKQEGADRIVEEVVEGKTGIHEGMLALQEADIAMKALLQVRNKVISAYNDVMKMQV
ncbi:MAG: flagellar hook-basal body complex protein FliE [Desulfobacterales bacterium]|nr:flagellar hook-basal body complex protein FliE [Desulfobacterales bacterium]